MTLSLALLLIWALTANIIAMLPSKHRHWPAAYGLFATGVPLIIFVFYQNNAFINIVAFAAWCSVLRWPLLYGYRWIRRKLGLEKENQ